MYKIRIKYSILDTLKFISHADTTRLLFRVFRQIKLPLVYSQGFSPHPVASFGPARPVGIASVCELMDVSLTKEISLQKTKADFNRKTPPELKIDAIKYIDGHDPAFKELLKAVYVVKLPSGLSISKKTISSFLKPDEITVKRQKKDKLIDFNIRPGIYSLKIEKNRLWMELKIGDNSFPPFLLLEKLFDKHENIKGASITRKEFKV